MICIFSVASDQTTTDVVRWLRHLGAKDIVRVNADAPLEECSLVEASLDNLSFQVKGRVICLDEITAAWYRKGRNWLCSLATMTQQRYSSEGGKTLAKTFESALQAKFRNETTAIVDFVHRKISRSVPTLGTPDSWRLNKLQVLEAAYSIGLTIPEFLVSSCRDAIVTMSESGTLVTKATSDGLYFFDRSERRGYFSYTELIDLDMTKSLPPIIPPSFVQSYVEKLYDVRIFFLEGKLYSMAILSQQDCQTRVDFRKYNEEKPNRAVPYELPCKIQDMLKLLFSELRLNTGSVDMAVSADDTHYFLEVNPVGQFGMMSESCNFNLERKVAEWLLRHAK